MKVSSEVKLIAFCSIFLLSSCASLQKKHNTNEEVRSGDVLWDYIIRYQSVAVDEMQRSKIPASIKMAQAILESGAGQSQLAKLANNHFGIKCGPSWQGKKFYKKDDEYKNGQLHKSCFRVYNSGEDSFADHSAFLTDQAKGYRYGFLFDLNPKDYKSWARGLQKAGYATHPSYAGRLIKLIERYELDRLDRGLLFRPKPFKQSAGRWYVVQKGDNLYRIAKKFAVRVEQIKSWNQLHSDHIDVGQRLYLGTHE